MSLEYNVWPTVPMLLTAAAGPTSTASNAAQGSSSSALSGVSRSASPPTSNVFTLRDPRLAAPVQAIAFGDGMLASTGDNAVVIWKLTDWKMQRTLSGRRGTRFDLLCWDPRGLSSRLASVSSSDRTLRLWDLRAKGDQQTEFQTNGDLLTNVAWSPDGNSIVLGTNSNLSLYDVRQNRILTSRKFDHIINQFAYQGGDLLMGTERGNIEVLDPNNFSSRRSVAVHPAEVNCVAVNPKNTTQFATGADDALIEIWNNDHDDLTCGTTVDRHISRIETLSFSANGKWLASSSYREKTIDVSVVDSGELLTSLTFDQNIRSVCFDLNESGEMSYLAFISDNSRDVFIQPITGMEAGQEQRPSSRIQY